MQNNEMVRALETIVTLMEIKDEAYYRVLGYQRAAESVGALAARCAEVEDLTELPHVGETTAEVIRDLAEDRTPEILAELSEEIPRRPGRDDAPAGRRPAHGRHASGKSSA